MIQPSNPPGPPDDDSRRNAVKDLFQYLKIKTGYHPKSSQYFGKYNVHKVLRSRQHSAVLLVYDPDLRRQVVLKVYKPDLSQDQKTLILTEGQALAQIDCEHVARCLAVESMSGCPSLVLEYIPGTPLDKLKLPLKAGAAREIIRQVAVATKAVHQRGLLHLDLKPSNVILTDQGTVKLIDFGLAQPVSNVRFGEVSGTPSYMAPEVANHEIARIDQRADVFGLGAILYSLLTREPPFSGDSIDDVLKAAQLGQIQPVRRLRGRRSRDIVTICEKCLSCNPVDRFADVDAMLEAVERPRSTRRVWLWAALAVLVLLFAAALYWGLGKRPLSLATENILLHLAMESRQPYSTPDDFRLEVMNDEFDDHTVSVFRQSDKPVQLKIRSEIAVQLAVYSVQYDSEDPSQVEVFLAGQNRNRGLRSLDPGETTSISLTFDTPTPPGKTEYLVIAARDEIWSPKKTLASVIQRLPDRNMRGVNEPDESYNESVIVLPYRVVPPDRE